MLKRCLYFRISLFKFGCNTIYLCNRIRFLSDEKGIWCKSKTIPVAVSSIFNG